MRSLPPGGKDLIANVYHFPPFEGGCQLPWRICSVEGPLESGLPSSSGCVFLQSIFDLQHFTREERKLGRAHDAGSLFRTAEAYDCACHGWIIQRPGDGHFSRRPTVAISDIAKTLDQFQIPRE